METKTKLINVFKQLLQSATLKELSRIREAIPVYDFEEKCEKHLTSLQEHVPQGIDCSVYYSADRSFYIKLKEFDKEYIHIFPVTAEYNSYFDTVKSNAFIFGPKGKKYKELFEIYLKHGLNGYQKWNGGYDFSGFVGIAAKKKSYAISYGQIMRELTHDEYQELANLYLDKLCKLDLKFIENKIENKDEK